MTYTRHGHHIDGTTMEPGEAPKKARCGGPKFCGMCATDVGQVIRQELAQDAAYILPVNEDTVLQHDSDQLDCQPGCPKCRVERMDESYTEKARRIVFEYIKPRLEKTDQHVAMTLNAGTPDEYKVSPKHKTFSLDEVMIVWFSKTLQNWKALVTTTLPDGMYYEVTHNGTGNVTYVDVYKKFDNVVVPD